MRHLLQSLSGTQRQRGAREPEYPGRKREVGSGQGMGWGREEDEAYLQEVQGDGVILLGCHLHQPLQVLKDAAR